MTYFADHAHDDSGAYLRSIERSRYRARVLLILFATMLAAVLVACGHRRGGGGGKPPDGGGGGGKPPGEQRMSEPEFRQRAATLAAALKIHPADRSSTPIVKRMAQGAQVTLAEFPLDWTRYWDADVAMRIGGPGLAQWLAGWLRLMSKDGDGDGPGEGWFHSPRGSENHQLAVLTGCYFAWKVLGPQGYAANGGGRIYADPAVAVREFMCGKWSCCGAGGKPPECGNHPPYVGEIIGSRHYGVRSWSDLMAIADMGGEPEATLAAEALDKSWAFLAVRVRSDGVWPEDSIPRVRPTRDLCYWPPLNRANEWPDPAIRRKYAFLDAHPSFTPHITYLLDLRVKAVNMDFMGHVKPSVCRSSNRPDWCDNLGGQGAYPDECDERSEVNNAGLLLGGRRWRPLKF